MKEYIVTLELDSGIVRDFPVKAPCETNGLNLTILEARRQGYHFVRIFDSKEVESPDGD